MAEETVKPWDETRIIGKPIPPVDGYERVSGTAVYSLDVILPNMLYGAILRCPHGHATVKKVDVGKARKMPGVRAVLTDADPEARIGWYAPMRPPGPPVAGRPQVSRLFDPHCRYEGEEVAAVAAESPQQAWDAVRAIQVEYETLPSVTDMEEALKPGAPPVQESGNRAGAPSETKRGSIEQGFAEADVVLEETYRNCCQLHSPLEVHGSVAQWDGDRLTVWDTNQGPFGIQAGIARALNIPLSKVRVITKYMGGGFGSKQEAGKYTIIAALLAQKVARPVKLFLTREAEFLCVGNRPAHVMTLKAGVKKDGTLTALQLTAMGEMGAYASGASVGMLAGELYKCPNVSIAETSVYINAGQARAFRAPGSPEGSWALEQMLDSLAERIGMDPVDLRLKNITTVSQTTQNKPYTSTGLSESLAQGAKAFGWKEARSRPKGSGPLVRGVGVASGMFMTGFAPATAILKLFPDGSANLNFGAADLGTGTKTFAAMIVAEELGVPLDRIEIENADTGTTQYSSVSGGSKTAATDGVPIRLAALEIKGLLLEMAAQQLKVPVADLVFQDGAILAQAGAQKLAITDLTQMRMQNGVVGVGRQRPITTEKIVRGFATEFAEVEVNTRTGEMRVLRMLAADDAGRVLSLLTYRNQVWGGMLQGLGLAMTERRVMDSDSGKMVNANFHDYKIPTAKDVPEMTCLPIDMHDNECNINGVKGIGEPCHVPAAAAIANAFYNATGVRATAAPITAAQILTLLAERKAKG
jgi:xanthine dehydrogenase YagR molybdenum-binding subunit